MIDYAKENAKIIDRFHRYLGETLVRCLDGTWLHIDMSADRGPEAVVEVPMIMVGPRDA